MFSGRRIYAPSHISIRMIFSYNWLKTYFPSLPDPYKLAELLTLRAFQTENVRREGKDYLLDVDILSNRAVDAQHYDGMAREIGVLLGKEPKMRKVKVKESRERIDKQLCLRVEEKTDCPRYTLRMMRQVRIGESPEWLKARLQSAGLRPINSVVDAANYIMLKTGHPIHVFDYDRVGKPAPLRQRSKKKNPTLPELVIRRADRGEGFTSLEDKHYVLNSEMLVISDGEGDILGLAGIKGGRKAEVTKKTTTIILEAAQFSGPLVRRTSRMLGLRTAAAVRFMQGVDPDETPVVLGELSALISETSGGIVLRGMLDVYNGLKKRTTIRLRHERIESLLGGTVPKETVTQILRRLFASLRVISGTAAAWDVRVPSFRPDLVLEEDIVEEVARIYGYDKIAPETVFKVGPPDASDRFYEWSEQVHTRLTYFGFSELLSYSLVGEEFLSLLEPKQKKAVLELANPTRPELHYLRPVLLFGALDAIRKNQDSSAASRVFEIGRIYRKSMLGSAVRGVFEEPHVVFALARPSVGGENFFALKGVLTALLESLGFAGSVWFDDAPASASEFHEVVRSLLHPYRSAQVKVDQTALGQMGELHPEVARRMKLKERVAVCELSLPALAGIADRELEYQPISRYPALARDCALLVPRGTKVIEVLDVIENTAGKLLSDTDLFDIYEGEEIPEGKKNLAFHLIFQSNERTLTDGEVDAVMKRIIHALEERPEWEVRK